MLPKGCEEFVPTGAGDTGAVTVGPQIPHPVAPALASQAEEGEGHLVPGRAGCSLAKERHMFGTGREESPGEVKTST